MVEDIILREISQIFLKNIVYDFIYIQKDNVNLKLMLSNSGKIYFKYKVVGFYDE